ncbi:MAG: CsgG/HfaB family protein [Tannerella sp.]|nr:CsgG/HfaB family protein [Tannerella sp.]
MCLFISATVQAQQDLKVAVFDPEGTVEKTLLEIVREEISSAVVNTKGYTVLERQLINKVLEENKFQESGLVSDAQVSDIGKIMGADYVFVTTISALAENYYISCKMIEVATARIEKQFTGTTTDGINDIPQTAQFIVKRLFGENVKQQVAQRAREQPREPVQRPVTPVTRQAEPVYYGNLTASGMNIYSSGRALSRNDVRAMMANTDALRYYNGGIKKRKAGNFLVTAGFVFIAAGAVLTYALPIEYGSSYYNGSYFEYDYYTEPDYGFLAAGGLVGLGLAIPGFILKGSGKRNVRKAVDVYNSGNYGYSEPPAAFEIDFGVTQSGGIGLVMTF